MLDNSISVSTEKGVGVGGVGDEISFTNTGRVVRPVLWKYMY